MPCATTPCAATQCIARQRPVRRSPSCAGAPHCDGLHDTETRHVAARANAHKTRWHNNTAQPAETLVLSPTTCRGASRTPGRGAGPELGAQRLPARLCARTGDEVASCMLHCNAPVPLAGQLYTAGTRWVACAEFVVRRHTQWRAQPRLAARRRHTRVVCVRESVFASAASTTSPHTPPPSSPSPSSASSVASRRPHHTPAARHTLA